MVSERRFARHACIHVVIIPTQREAREAALPFPFPIRTTTPNPIPSRASSLFLPLHTQNKENKAGGGGPLIPPSLTYSPGAVYSFPKEPNTSFPSFTVAHSSFIPLSVLDGYGRCTHKEVRPCPRINGRGDEARLHDSQPV